MKKIILSLVFGIMSLVSFAQVFTCEKLQNDVEKYKQIQKKYKNSGNKIWSKELFKEFPCHDDGTITYEYILKSDSIFNIEDLHTNILNWCKVRCPINSPIEITSNNHISSTYTLTNVGRAIGYMNATFINAKGETTVDIKENRIKVVVKILLYMSGNTWNGAEVVLPGSCFPCNPNGSQKDSHAMAFINCHFNSLDIVQSLMKHLNDNISTIQNGEDEW